MSITDQFRTGFCAATLAILLAVAAAARGSTTDLAQYDLAPAQPFWSFVAAGGRLHAGDIILCRSDTTEPASPWFVTQVLSVEIDGSVLIMQPLGQGVSKMVQLAASEILDIARPRKPTQ
jgi:hypothetical protein